VGKMERRFILFPRRQKGSGFLALDVADRDLESLLLGLFGAARLFALIVDPIV
jgi:hypothetical protein